MFPEVGSLQIQRLELNEATEHESELLFQPASRQSQLAGFNSKWNLGAVAAAMGSSSDGKSSDSQIHSKSFF